jgi:hypothetical protein
MHGSLDGAPVPEPFRVGGHGRIASDFGSLLCQPESCPGAAGGTGRGLALVECRAHINGADDGLVTVRPGQLIGGQLIGDSIPITAIPGIGMLSVRLLVFPG